MNPSVEKYRKRSLFLRLIYWYLGVKMKPHKVEISFRIPFKGFQNSQHGGKNHYCLLCLKEVASKHTFLENSLCCYMWNQTYREASKISSDSFIHSILGFSMYLGVSWIVWKSVPVKETRVYFCISFQVFLYGPV